MRVGWKVSSESRVIIIRIQRTKSCRYRHAKTAQLPAIIIFCWNRSRMMYVAFYSVRATWAAPQEVGNSAGQRR